MPVQTDDKVWFDLRYRLAGIANEVKELWATENVLVLAHFPATLSAVEMSMRAAGITFQTFSQFDSSTLCSKTTTSRVMVGLVRALQTPSVLTQSSTSELAVIVAEHHPRAKTDLSVIEIVEKLPCRATVHFHTSLDDPLLKHFGGEKLVTLVKRLGMDESECIAHRFVTSAIRNAQENLEQKVSHDLPTESIEDWFKFNLRSHQW
jgi:hypothetical protein